MRPRTYSSEAVVLSRKNYGEADRILTVFSRHFGKLRLLAKGVRKPRSRKRGHIEVFSRIRFSVSKGNWLDIITEAELIDSYDIIRKDLKKVAVAYYICEVMNYATREEEKNQDIFEKLVFYLSLIGRENKLGIIRKQFVYDILVDLGFWPKGKILQNPDLMIEEIIERKLGSARVGKKVLN